MASHTFKPLTSKSSPFIKDIEEFVVGLEEPAGAIVETCSESFNGLDQKTWLSFVCTAAVVRGIMLDLTITSDELEILRDVAVYADVIPANMALPLLRDMTTKKDSPFRDAELEKTLFQGLAQYDSQAGTTYVATAKRIIISLMTKAIELDGPLKRFQRDWLKQYEKALDANALAGLDRIGIGTTANSNGVAGSVTIPKTTFSSIDKEKDLADAVKELNDLIGLDRAKGEVSQLIDFLKVQKMRAQQGLPKTETSRHLVFSGDLGTGKTTVARLLARIFYCLEVVSKGHLVESDRSTLVAGYLGQTAIRVRKVVDEARGGGLFIDEAYSLTNGPTNDPYGQEAVATLVKLMEDYRDDLIVIVAGYPDKMGEFIAANPGLRSRFTKYVYFEDYMDDDMVAIFLSQCNKAGLVLSSDAKKKVSTMCEYLYAHRDKDFGNARDVRNKFEETLANQASRLAKLSSPTRAMLCAIEASDIGWHPELS